MRIFCLLLGAAVWLQAAENPSAASQQAEAIAKQRAAIALQRQAVAAQPGIMPTRHVTAFAPPPACDPMPKEKVDALLHDASVRQDLPVDLLRAVVSQESGFRPCAVSSKGAMGLMQLMPGTAGQLGVTDPFDPRQNVESGAKYLKQLLERYGGDTSLALGAYNAGPARVDAAGGVPDIEETLHYVQSILGSLPR